MTTQPTTKSRKPTHAAYYVTGKGDSANWIRLGGAWPHKDGNGFNVPFEGRLVIRLITEKAPAEEPSA